MLFLVTSHATITLAREQKKLYDLHTHILDITQIIWSKSENLATGPFYPAGISTLIQRWNNVMPQRWNDVEFWLNMKVEWTLKFWRWFNVDIWRCFNVDLTSSDVVTTFKFSWYLVEMLQLFDLEHWFFFANCSESFCLKLFYEQHDTRTNIINQFIQERNS